MYSSESVRPFLSLPFDRAWGAVTTVEVEATEGGAAASDAAVEPEAVARELETPAASLKDADDAFALRRWLRRLSGWDTVAGGALALALGGEGSAGEGAPNAPARPGNPTPRSSGGMRPAASADNIPGNLEPPGSEERRPVRRGRR